VSTRESVLAAIAARLATLAGGRVYRSRQAQLPALPAIVIEPLSEEGTEEVLGRMSHTLRVAVRVFGRGDAPETAIDAVLADAWAAVSESPDLDLGSDVQVSQSYSIGWDFDDDDLVRATLGIEVYFRTTLTGM
jgi:hypothetical protein